MSTANTSPKTNYDAIRELSIDQLANILLVANGPSARREASVMISPHAATASCIGFNLR